MKLKAITMLLVVAAAWVVPANAVMDPDNPNCVMFQDEFGDPLDYYVEAFPGDTVTLWMVINRTPNWSQVSRVRGALWFDAAVVANAYSGDGSVRVTPDYTGSTVTGYGYTEDYTVAQDWPNYYMFWDMFDPGWGGPGQGNYPSLNLFEGSPEAPYRVIGFNIPIRPDAPLGLMSVGAQMIGTDFWDGIVIWEENTTTWPENQSMQIRVVSSHPGDFDDDGDVDSDDIGDLCANLTGSGVPAGDPKYDLDGDGDADQADMDMLIHDLVEITGGDGTGTEYADFDLDGDVDTTDLTILATNFGLGTTWLEGNANCDLVIDTTDLTILATNFGYVASGAVPEPATMSLLALGSLALLRRRSR